MDDEVIVKKKKSARKQQVDRRASRPKSRLNESIKTEKKMASHEQSRAALATMDVRASGQLQANQSMDLPILKDDISIQRLPVYNDDDDQVRQSIRFGTDSDVYAGRQSHQELNHKASLLRYSDKKFDQGSQSMLELQGASNLPNLKTNFNTSNNTGS